MTSPVDPETAVKFARAAAVAERSIGPHVTLGVLAAYDAALADVGRLQAIVDGDPAIRDLAAYELGRADAEAERVPPPPAQAPPRQGPARAERALTRVKAAVRDNARKSRLPEDPPGEANGPLVVAVKVLKAAYDDVLAAPDAAPKAGR